MAPKTNTSGIPLVNSNGEPLPVWALKDALALVVHQLLDQPDESTRHDVEYESAEGETHTVSQADPYTWDLSTFRLKAKDVLGQIVIEASCEVAE